MKIIRGPVPSAQRVVIYGPEGVGKTTLASKFPNPLFIDTENGTFHLDVARMERPSSWAMMMQQVEYVRNNPGICDTLVIDTIDWAESVAIDHLCAKDNVKSIEFVAGGYGKGYTRLTETLGSLLNLLNDVIETGTHVVLTAHAQTTKFEEPGESGAYDKWALKLLKRNMPLTKEWADMVLFANFKTFVVNTDGKGVEKGRNIATGGKRVMYTSHNPAWDAKNRHGLPAEIDMDYEAIAHCFLPREKLALATSTPAPTPQPEAQPKPAPEPAPEPTSQLATETESVPAEQPPEDTDLESQGVPKALADLMRTNNVTVEDIQRTVADRGYFPLDTPIANYPSDFVEGVLIGAWEQVYESIEKNKAPF